MEIALYVLLGLLAAFVAFVLLPSVLSFCIVFGRVKTEPYGEMKKAPPYLSRFSAELTEAEGFIRSLSAREITVCSSDGVSLTGEYIDGGFDKTVIFFHGFKAEAHLSFLSQARWFYGQGYNLLFATLRGHGKSGGRWITLGLREKEDVLAYVRWAEEEKAIGKVLLYGTSMGCTSLAFASDGIKTDGKVKAMILDCGFTCPEAQLTRDGAKMHLPWRIMLPATRILSKLLWKADISASTTDALSRTAIPALFLHGAADTIVPVEESKRDFDACASPKEIFIAPGAEHTTSFLTCPEEVKEKIGALLRAYFA